MWKLSAGPNSEPPSTWARCGRRGLNPRFEQRRSEPALGAYMLDDVHFWPEAGVLADLRDTELDRLHIQIGDTRAFIDG